MNQHFVAVRIKPEIYSEMKGLHERAMRPISNEDKALGADLLAQTYVLLLDTCFTRLLDELNASQPDRMLSDASGVIHKVQSEAQHYIGWLIKFISNKRVPPVIHHFHDLVQLRTVGSETGPFVMIPVTQAYAAKARSVMDSLQQGDGSRLEEGVELLIEAIETALAPLVLTPKDLMDFNFVVSKTINGVISVLLKLFKHTLRKLPPHIKVESCPMIGAHFDVFLV